MKTENSLPEISIAERLPIPEKKPPHARALLLGLKPEVIGSRIREVMLFPASLAPLPKARKNRIASPSSVSIDNSQSGNLAPRVNRCRTFGALEQYVREG